MCVRARARARAPGVDGVGGELPLRPDRRPVHLKHLRHALPPAAAEFERLFGARPKVGERMLDLLDDQPAEREAVRALCAGFPGEYWRKIDRERAYPTAFVEALTKGLGAAADAPNDRSTPRIAAT